MRPLAALLAASLALPAAAQPAPMGAEARYEAAADSINRDVVAAFVLTTCGARSGRWYDTIRHAAWLMLGQYQAELRREARDPAAFDRRITVSAAAREERMKPAFPDQAACRHAIDRDLRRLDGVYDSVRYR